MNPMLLLDGYKLDHRRQYPKGTKRVYSNLTPRSSRVEGQKETVFFGLQYFLQKYMTEDMQQYFFNVNRDIIEPKYQRRIDGYLGPNSIGTKHICELHELGYIPLEFRALPEGTLTPLRVPMLTLENTHEDFAWLVNYIETLMSNILWMPCTSATTAHRFRQLLNKYAAKTGGDKNFIQWQGHDFSMRGMPGVEAAILSGAGHLLSFTGTDTVPALDLVDDYYPGDNGVVGGSCAATEHSVMCAGGEMGELETLDRLFDLYMSGIVSIVSDTWDLWRLITYYLPQRKERIMCRDGKVVIRPDSGDPVKILCGNNDSPVGSPEHKGVVELLWDIFGGKVNQQGYKELDPHIGAIYGDAINHERAEQICLKLQAKGFASTNVVLGIGSYSYQFVTRDTYGFAIKATWAKVGEEERNLFKKPVTDNGDKFSAMGRLAVSKDVSGRLLLINDASRVMEEASFLEPVWKNSKFIRRQSFADIRKVLGNI
jgi:nicotinamide phosphoribosyltransferase